MMPTGQHLLPEALCGQDLERIAAAQKEGVKARETPRVDVTTSLLPLHPPAGNSRPLVGAESRWHSCHREGLEESIPRLSRSKACHHAERPSDLLPTTAQSRGRCPSSRALRALVACAFSELEGGLQILL